MTAPAALVRARELQVGDRLRPRRGGPTETVTAIVRFRTGSVRRVLTDRVTRYGAQAWYGPTALVERVQGEA